MQLLHLISPTYKYNATTMFLSEQEIFDLIDPYLPPDHNITADKINYWMTTEKRWPAAKRKQVNKERKHGRELNVVDETLRGSKALCDILDLRSILIDFTWKDISNIQQYRKHVRCSEYLTIGYARKSKSEKKQSAVVNSINLETYKSKIKLLCTTVFGSYSNAYDPIEERDLKLNKFKFQCDGSTQGISDFAHTYSSQSNVLLAIIYKLIDIFPKIKSNLE